MLSAITPSGLFVTSLTDGEAPPSNDLAVDGSVTPVRYWAGPQDGEVWVIRGMSFVGLGVGIQNQLFVNLAALVNGLLLQYKTNDPLADTRFAMHDRNLAVPATCDFPIQTNADLSRLCGPSVLINTQGTDIIKGVWDFEDSGVDLRLEGTKGERLEALVQDDLSTLDGLFIQIHGHRQVDR